MVLWITQWYATVPAFSALNVFDPLENGWVSKLPSSAVTLWLVPSSLVTVIVSPTLAVRGVGEKEKFLIVIVAPCAADDADDADDEDVDDCVELFDDELLEHPVTVSSSSTEARTAAIGRGSIDKTYDARTRRPGRSPVGSPST